MECYQNNKNQGNKNLEYESKLHGSIITPGSLISVFFNYPSNKIVKYIQKRGGYYIREKETEMKARNTESLVVNTRKIVWGDMNSANN